MDLSAILGFDWDEGNARKSADKHSVSQAEAEQAFTDERVIVITDEPHSQTELRFHALGQTADGRLLQLTFTLREAGTKIRVISARPANRRERSIYEAET
jgi:uncharacterized DUF497 family protein